MTEIGMVNKSFIDCGGTLRHEAKIGFQLFTAEDYDHRLSVSKLQKIIALSQEKLGLGNYEVEVEYQSETISKYGLSFSENSFKLIPLQTDCLAKDKCGIPAQKPKIRLSALSGHIERTCDPNSGCC